MGGSKAGKPWTLKSGELEPSSLIGLEVYSMLSALHACQRVKYLSLVGRGYIGGFQHISAVVYFGSKCSTVATLFCESRHMQREIITVESNYRNAWCLAYSHPGIAVSPLANRKQNGVLINAVLSSAAPSECS